MFTDLELKEGAGDHMHIEAIRVADGEIAGSEMWNDSLYGGEVPEEMELPSRRRTEREPGSAKRKRCSRRMRICRIWDLRIFLQRK